MTDALQPRVAALRAEWRPGRRWRCAALGLCAAIAGDALRTPPLAAQCALQVKTEAAETSYRYRGYGCEGIYTGLQSAPLNVQVVSLVRGSFGLGQDTRSVVIHTSPAGAQDNALRAQTRVIGRAREANLNWAMDGYAQADTPMAWNLEEVIRPLELGADRIGVAGMRERQTGLGGPVFIPLAIAPPNAALPAQAPIEMVVRIPAASAVQWALSSGDPWADATDVHAADGYFGIVLPAGPPGVLQVLVRWRARSTPGWGEPERLSVYRW